MSSVLQIGYISWKFLNLDHRVEDLMKASTSSQPSVPLLHVPQNINADSKKKR